MAPFDPTLIQSNIPAYISLFTGAASITALIILISQTLRRAHASIPVAHRTRAQDARRRTSTWTFASLALLSLAVNLYTLVDMFVDSYRNWAYDKGQVFPVDVWTAPVWYPRPNSKDLQLGRWLQEGDLKDCVKIIGGSARDYWWYQQLALGKAVWSIFLAVEGRRRNIPYTWAFLFIAHSLGLSVSLNLFFLALLFTPEPLPANAAAAKSTFVVKMFGDAHSRPNTWVPKPIVYMVPLISSALCTAMLPYGIGSPFQDALLSGPQLLNYINLLVTNTAILPNSFGTKHRSIHAAHASTTPVFRAAALLSLALYAASTALAISSNTPPARRTLFDILFHDRQHATTALSASNLARYRTAIARVVGALSDHPLVQKIGWDVILCAASLCTWTGVRALSVNDMLSVAGPFGHAKEAAARGADAAKAKASAAAENALSGLAASADAGERENTLSSSPLASPKVRPARGGKAARTKTPTKARASAKTKTAKPTEDDDDEDDDDDDDDIVQLLSSPRVAAQAVEHEDERGAEDMVDGAESGALAWGFCILGGLGLGMAGMAGAEAA